jgi:hypothetical protein
VFEHVLLERSRAESIPSLPILLSESRRCRYGSAAARPGTPSAALHENMQHADYILSVFRVPWLNGLSYRRTKLILHREGMEEYAQII